MRKLAKDRPLSTSCARRFSSRTKTYVSYFVDGRNAEFMPVSHNDTGMQPRSCARSNPAAELVRFYLDRALPDVGYFETVAFWHS
eukprot:5979860-Amphidinium_carterae.1